MFLRYNLPAILWAIFILIVCSIPGSELPEESFFDFPGFDKVVHAGLYVMLEWLLVLGFSKQTSFIYLTKYAFVSSLFISIMYGGLIEILQSILFIERSGDYLDFLANALGAIIGLIVYKFFPFSK